MNTHANQFDFQSQSIRTFQSHRARSCKGQFKKSMCVFGKPELGLGFFNWTHDSQEDLFVYTSLFKKGLGASHLGFGLEVEAEGAEEPVWKEDINLFLDVYSKDDFWSEDIHPPQQWKCMTALKMNTTSARCGGRETQEINKLLQTLNVSNQSILIQSLYRLSWYQPKREPSSDAFFFDPEMEASFVPRHRPAPARRIEHVLLVYSERPLGSFVKTLIAQAILGTIPGKPSWQTIHGRAHQTLSAKDVFSHRQCRKTSLRLNAMEYKRMLTGNLLQPPERGHMFCPPF